MHWFIIWMLVLGMALTDTNVAKLRERVAELEKQASVCGVEAKRDH